MDVETAAIYGAFAVNAVAALAMVVAILLAWRSEFSAAMHHRGAGSLKAQQSPPAPELLMAGPMGTGSGERLACLAA
jgi:hypothetical protein